MEAVNWWYSSRRIFFRSFKDIFYKKKNSKKKSEKKNMEKWQEIKISENGGYIMTPGNKFKTFFRV